MRNLKDVLAFIAIYTVSNWNNNELRKNSFVNFFAPVRDFEIKERKSNKVYIIFLFVGGIGKKCNLFNSFKGVH